MTNKEIANKVIQSERCTIAIGIAISVISILGIIILSRTASDNERFLRIFLGIITLIATAITIDI
jgi:hypothetical protein